ncbi:AAA family ATPase [Nakamurella sp. YIM 132087]|uniref:AAA family ATPase n=1 Tax=Nakamurella alba TaxID=2665158 RepID=A0A7K1FLJ6_9ACTN|nr:BTAD domain-containing putative transcriptional regulator [Nakamurella alba]MTD15015.1 AAA family ATPase [Nakamurella alba]
MSPAAEWPGISFEVLGPLRALRSGRTLELGPARRRTTLAALLVDAGHVVPIDTLVDRIWDGAPPANPLTTVHAYVSRLRSGLRGSGSPDDTRPGPLETVAPGYRLSVPTNAVDAARFARLVTEADTSFRAGDLGPAEQALAAAGALWRDEPYADIPSAFARNEATRLTGLYGRLEEIGIDVDLARGRHALLVERLRTMVAADPLREGIQAALMLALYRSGRQADALTVFQSVRGLLADELGADPSRQLQTLHERILRQDTDLDLPAGAVTAGPRAVTAPAAPPEQAPADRTEQASSTRLIGRERELARVREILDSSGAAPYPAVVAVTGEAGIGKTRLLDELAGTADPGIVVAWGRSWDHEGVPPLWPWVEVLREIARGVGEDVVAAAVAGRGSAVLALDPDLVSGPAPGSRMPQGTIEDSEVRMFDGILHFLGAVTDRRKVLVLLEDVHWADPATRRFTEYAVTHRLASGLALVLTARAQSDDGGPGGAELLAALARTGRVHRLDLPGLRPDAVRDYVTDRTGTVLDHATTDALAERTGGNPFFVGEIVRLLVTDRDAGGAGADEGVTTEVPDSIRGVILRRVERLPADEKTVLRAAAVVGRTFDPDLLRDITDLDEETIDEAVDRATASGLLGSEPGAPGRHRFHHALVQQTLLEDIGPARRRRWHARTAAALLARTGGDTVAGADRIVHHLAASGSEDELLQAARLCIAASDAAHRRGHYSGAEQLLVTAVDLTARLEGEAGDRVEMAARTRLSSLYALSYHAGFPGFVAQRDRMTALVRRLGNDRDLLAGLQNAFAAAFFTCDFVEAAALAQEMISRGLAAGDDLMTLGGEFARGLCALQIGRPDEAIDALGTARDLARRLDEEVPVGMITVPVEAIGPWRLAAFALAGRWSEAGPDLADIPVLLRTPEPAARANIEGVLGVAHAFRGDVPAALRHGRAAVRIADEVGLGPILSYLGIVAEWATARIEGGTGRMREIVDLLPEQQFVVMRSHHVGLYADLLVRSGSDDHLAEATTRLDDAIAESARSGNSLWDAELHRLRARARELSGRPVADVVADLEQAVAIARAQSARDLLAKAQDDLERAVLRAR